MDTENLTKAEKVHLMEDVAFYQLTGLFPPSPPQTRLNWVQGNNCTIDNTKVTLSPTSNWNATCISQVLSDAQVKWGVKLVSSNNYVMVGVAPENVDLQIDSLYISCGWYLNLWHGITYSKNGSNDRISEPITQGSTVVIELNKTTDQISFKVDQKNCVVAPFKGVNLNQRLVAIVIAHNDAVVELAEC